MLKLQTLGRVRLIRDGVEIHLTPNRAYVLLLILAYARGRHVTREHVASILWDDNDLSAVRHSLSQVLYRIKKATDLDLRAANGCLHLPAGLLEVDALVFVRAVRDRMHHAAELALQGDFLESFDIQHARAFHEWRDARSADIDHAATDLFASIIEEREEAGDWSGVELYANRLIARHPHDEFAHAARIRAIAASGEYGRARRAYAILHDSFLKDLGEAPPANIGAEVQAWADTEVLRRLSADHSSTVECKFVGRQSAFALLRRDWEVTRTHGARMVVVTGEPGVGKTRLSTHLLRLAVLQGARILHGTFYPLESRISYSGIADALRTGAVASDFDSRSSPLISHLAALIPEDGIIKSVVSDRSHAAGQDRHFAEAFFELVRQIASERPVVLFLDDTQWGDVASLGCVQHLLRRLTSQPVFILLACRSVTSTQLPRIVRTLLERNSLPVNFLHLQPLDDVGAEELIAAHEHATSFAIPAEVRARVVTQAAGIPLFILEILRELAKYPSDSVYDREVLLPASIQFVLQSRLDRLQRTDRRVLEALAVLGREAAVNLLCRVLRLEASIVVGALGRLTRRGLTREFGDNIVVGHELLRQTIYENMSLAKRRYLHGRIAQSLADNSYVEPGVVAFHFAEAGQRRDAWSYELDAARKANSLYAYDDAEFFLRKCLVSAPDDAQKMVVLDQLIWLLIKNRRFTDAAAAADQFTQMESHPAREEAIFTQRVIELCSRNGTSGASFESVFADGEALLASASRLGRVDAFAAILGVVIEVAHDADREDFMRAFLPVVVKWADELGEGAERARLLSLAARIHCVYVSAERSLAIADEAVRAAYGLMDPASMIPALISRGTSRTATGDVAGARSDFDDAAKIASKPELRGLRQRIYNNHAVLLTEIGLYDEARHLLQAGLGQGDRRDDMFLLANLAILYFETGKFNDTFSCTSDLIRSDSELGTPWALRIAYALRGLCALRVYNLALAKDCHDAVGATADSPYGNGDISYIEQFRAEMLVHLGCYDEALQRLRESAARMKPVNVFACSRLELKQAQLVGGTTGRDLAQQVVARHRIAGAIPLAVRAEHFLSA